MSDADLMLEIEQLKKEVKRLKLVEYAPVWTMLTTPLTSTSWDGDAYSTTAKTKIDLSAVFGVPAGVKAVLVRLYGRDSGSSGGSYFVGLSSNSTANELALVVRLANITNDSVRENTSVCPCDSAGDVYYQISASGASTLDVWIEIWGYLL